MALSRNRTSDEVSSRATATCTRPGQLLPGSCQQCSGARITLLLQQAIWEDRKPRTLSSGFSSGLPSAVPSSPVLPSAFAAPAVYHARESMNRVAFAGQFVYCWETFLSANVRRSE